MVYIVIISILICAWVAARKHKDKNEFEAQFDEYIEKRMGALKEKIGSGRVPPSVALIQIGNDENDTEYCNKYIERCREAGVNVHWYGFDEGLADWELVQEIKDLGNHYNGLVIKLSHCSPITGAQAHAAIPPGKNIMGLARAIGVMNFLEDVGCDLRNIAIYSNKKDLYQPLVDMAVEKYSNVQVKILPETQSRRGNRGFTKEHLDELGFVESIENVFNEHNTF